MTLNAQHNGKGHISNYALKTVYTWYVFIYFYLAISLRYL